MKIQYHFFAGCLIFWNPLLALISCLPDSFSIFLIKKKWLSEYNIWIILHRLLHSLFFLLIIFIITKDLLIVSAWALHIIIDYASHDDNTRTPLFYPLRGKNVDSVIYWWFR